MKLFVKDRQFYRNLFFLALPLIGQTMINHGVNMMDTIMLGNFGEVAISGSSLANQFYLIFTILHFGLSGGAAVMTGQFWGRNEIQHIRGIITLALRISICISLVMSLLSYFAGTQIMSFYTNDPLIIDAGAKYLKLLSFGYLMHGVSLTLVIIFRTVHLVKLGFFSSLISFFVNIFFNWMFIFGTLGAPRMEIEGAALGTIIARFSEFVIVAVYVFCVDKRVSYRLKSLFLPVREYIHSFIRRGAPVIISDAMLAFGENMLAMVMGQMGAVVVAANSITAVVVQCCTVFSMGLAGAASVIAGNAVGAGEYEKAEREGITLFALSVLIGIFAAAVILLLSPLIVNAYNVSDETKSLAGTFMSIMAVIVVFQASAQTLTKGILRGGGDTKFLMAADVAFLWLASIPLGALAGLVLHWDPAVVYFLLKIDLVIKSVWCIFRLYSRKWIHLVRVED